MCVLSWKLNFFIYNNIKIYDCFYLSWIFKRSVWYFKPCQFLQYEYQFKSTNYLYCVIQVWIPNCKNLEKIIYTVISVMYKGLYHAFGTKILQYIIPVSFNTKCVSVYTVKYNWWLGVGLHLTKIVTWKKLFYTTSAIYWYDIAFLVSKQFSKADLMKEISGNPLYRFGKQISWNASKPSSVKEIDIKCHLLIIGNEHIKTASRKYLVF